MIALVNRLEKVGKVSKFIESMMTNAKPASVIKWVIEAILVSLCEVK